MSVAGLRPGFGRGGMTHSLVVMDILGAASVGGGLMTEAMDILFTGGGGLAEMAGGAAFGLIAGS